VIPEKAVALVVYGITGDLARRMVIRALLRGAAVTVRDRGRGCGDRRGPGAGWHPLSATASP
jgi:hypothetical protein